MINFFFVVARLFVLGKGVWERRAETQIINDLYVYSIFSRVKGSK